jgi:hypothetical protein
LIREIEPDVVGFTILAPYPGTDFYDHEKYKDVDWSAVGEYWNDIWYTEHFSNADLFAHQQYFMYEYKDKLCEVQRGIND